YLITGIDRKIALDELAEGKGLDFDELLTELEAIVEAGIKINIDYFLKDVLEEGVEEDIIDYFQETEEDNLEEAIQDLGEDYTEEEIRLVRIKFLSDMGN
ncbi:MAG: ATP-dependent DNA helicase RecQ, partial [Muribaculaceae bacterium]|nr:ATP-dependent DNA helicase RecQ [Muribaculaceae bacterium]